MRKPVRQRCEFWVRHSPFEIEAMLPGAYDAPRWLVAPATSQLERTQRKMVLDAKKRREKAARATRSKVAADRANAEAAKAYADKRVEALTRAGKL